jgi:hypothetical protein
VQLPPDYAPASREAISSTAGLWFINLRSLKEFASDQDSSRHFILIFASMPVDSGDSYADLGATITGPQQDLNLGIHLYVDGAPTDTVQLGTTTPGTHSINYVATDTSGLTATSTRTVIIAAPEAVNDNSSAMPTDASSTPALDQRANDNQPTGELGATGTE